MRGFSLTTVVLIGLGIAISGVLPAQAQEDGGLEIVECKRKRQIQGTWKLKSLYEEPSGALMEERKSHPNQYIRFRRDGLYFNHKPKHPYKSLKEAHRELTKASDKDIWQFIVGKQGGVVYLYKNQVFSHSYYCGKVKKASGSYAKGNIILTPTDAGNTKTYITYERISGKKYKFVETKSNKIGRQKP